MSSTKPIRRTMDEASEHRPLPRSTNRQIPTSSRDSRPMPTSTTPTTSPERQPQPTEPRRRSFVYPPELVGPVDRSRPDGDPRHHGGRKHTPHEGHRKDQQQRVGDHGSDASSMINSAPSPPWISLPRAKTWFRESTGTLGNWVKGGIREKLPGIHNLPQPLQPILDRHFQRKEPAKRCGGPRRLVS